MQKHGIGQSAERVEDVRFLTGKGCYVGDMALPNQLHGVVLMSPHAHARITRIDATTARAADGVAAVLTAAEVAEDKLGTFGPLFMPEDMGGPKGFRTKRPLLAGEVVRFVGDRVAFVVAETEEQARSAAEMIEVDYEPLPALVDIDDAMKPDAPKIWEGCADNVCFTVMFGDKEKTAAVFAAAKHVVSLRLENNRITANAMEPRGAIGEASPDGTMTLWTSNQNPHGGRTMLCNDIFKIPETKLRVITPDVGGGFGMKADVYPEDALVLWAARRTGRPVKWIGNRADSLLGDNVGRGEVVRGEMALDADGKILGVRVRAAHGIGPYIVSAAAATVLFSSRFVPSVYDIEALDLEGRAVFTNTGTLGPYRGAGRPEAVYITERLLDKAAKVIGISPADIRRRNFIRPEAFPYRTPTHFVFDSGEFEVALDKCMALADWAGFEARRAASEKAGLRRGRGIACFIEQGGIFNERMELRFDPSGMVTIVAGTHSHGQGHATTYAQMVTDWLGVPFEAIRFIQGDTEKVPFGRGTYAARSSMLGGAALKNASDIVIQKGKAMAAFLLEAKGAEVEFADGIFRIADTNRTMPLTDVAKAFYRKGGIPREFGLGLEATGSYAADPPNFPNGCHCCEVEIDPQTGSIVVDRYTSVDDCGRVVNPMICRGQIHGGVAQGLGQAQREGVVYDRESGQLLSGSFMDYAMPRASDLPDILGEFHEVPCKTNPLGIKGIGEAGTIAAPVAFMNAVADALDGLGVDCDTLQMPATPQRIWAAIAAARPRAAA
jgi:carbon-monoxide dehydrogenase large subunit